MLPGRKALEWLLSFLYVSMSYAVIFSFLLTTFNVNLQLGAEGLPHTALEEDNWKGYFIPDKTIVNINIGFIMHDPRIWGSDVEEFKPERFMGDNAKTLPEPSSLSFGFGKRCVSYNIMSSACNLSIMVMIHARIHYMQLHHADLANCRHPVQDMSRQIFG